MQRNDSHRLRQTELLRFKHCGPSSCGQKRTRIEERNTCVCIRRDVVALSELRSDALDQLLGDRLAFQETVK
jgi:hypothetical protein